MSDKDYFEYVLECIEEASETLSNDDWGISIRVAGVIDIPISLCTAAEKQILTDLFKSVKEAYTKRILEFPL